MTNDGLIVLPNFVPNSEPLWDKIWWLLKSYSDVHGLGWDMWKIGAMADEAVVKVQQAEV